MTKQVERGLSPEGLKRIEATQRAYSENRESLQKEHMWALQDLEEAFHRELADIWAEHGQPVCTEPEST